MNRSEIRLLQEFKEYPSVSILMPINVSFPETIEDQTRLDKLVRQVQDQLKQQMPERDIQPVLDNLATLVSSIDFRKNLGQGLVLLANRHFAKKYVLPFSLRERVVVSESFALRDLVESMKNTVRYRVLVFSEPRARLYMGCNDELKEITTDEFPMEHQQSQQVFYGTASSAIPGSGHHFGGGTMGNAPLPDDYTPDISGIRDEHLRMFFRDVDKTLGRYMQNDNSPLILAATDKNVALYKEVTKNLERIEGSVIGSFEKNGHIDLKRHCVEIVERWEKKQMDIALQELEASIKGNRYATGIREVWQTAREGRCKTVLVERSYFCPATVQADGKQIEPIDNLDYTGPGMLPDAVDALIGEVLSDSGDVCFVDDGALEKFDHVAAVLRY